MSSKLLLIFVACMSGFIELSNAIVKMSLTVGDNLNFYFPKSCLPIEVYFEGDQFAVFSEMGSEFTNAGTNSNEFYGLYNSTHVSLNITQVTSEYAGVYIIRTSSGSLQCTLDLFKEYHITITEVNTVEPSTTTVSTSTTTVSTPASTLSTSASTLSTSVYTLSTSTPTVSTSTPAVLTTQQKNTNTEPTRTVTATVIVPKTTSTDEEHTTDSNISSTEGHNTLFGTDELYLPIGIAVGVTLCVSVSVGALIYICIKRRRSNGQKNDKANTGKHRGADATTKKYYGRKQNVTESKPKDNLKVDADDEYHIYAEPDNDVVHNNVYQDNNAYIHPTYCQSNNASYGYYSEPQSAYEDPIQTKVISGYLEFSGLDNAKQTVKNNIYTIPGPATDNSVGYSPLSFHTSKETTTHNAKRTQNNVYTTPGPKADNSAGYTPLNFDTFKGKAV